MLILVAADLITLLGSSVAPKPCKRLSLALSSTLLAHFVYANIDSLLLLLVIFDPFNYDSMKFSSGNTIVLYQKGHPGNHYTVSACVDVIAVRRATVRARWPVGNNLKNSLSHSGWWISSSCRRVDGKRVGRVQRDPATAQRRHLRQVPARHVHQAQAVLWAGHQHGHQPGNDPWQEDAVGKRIRGQRRFCQHVHLPESSHRCPVQERQPVSEWAQPRLRWPGGDRHHWKP